MNKSVDILDCIANLSSDEVFTSPDIANKLLDLLPQDLFGNPDAKFLDPACKSGVILREIAKRLHKGLEKIIPDPQERINHILSKQVFGISITAITSVVSRRTLYYNKDASLKDKSAATCFDNRDGNILFDIKANHKYGSDDKCVYCGADRKGYNKKGVEKYAYNFIHDVKFEELKNMKFDVIISNPPYQLSFKLDGGNSSNAKSIYNLFIDEAIKLQPRYIVMITPSRWMTKTAQGIPDKWVDDTLKTNKFITIHDFENSRECFPSVNITGGINYFLWSKDYVGKCNYYFHKANSTDVIYRNDYLDSMNSGIVVRDPDSYSIIEKIINKEGDYFNKNNFSDIVSPKHFFDNGLLLTSNWTDYKDSPDDEYNIKYYLNINKERSHKWISINQIPKNSEVKDLNKVFIPAANGGERSVLGKPLIGEANSVCSQTFLVIGYNKNYTIEECENIIHYIKTKFFRYLVSIKKKTQNGPRGVYQFVPIVDFNKKWVDEELYKKYNLSDDEIKLIEDSIDKME